MQIGNFASELGQGLRRNVSMHIAVVLTLFVSLTLVGFGALMQQESDLIVKRLGSSLEIRVWLCKTGDDRPNCQGTEVTDSQVKSLQRTIEDNPAVDSVTFESQEVAMEKTKEISGDELFTGPDPIMTVEDLRASFRIKLDSPSEDGGVASEVEGLPGVSYINDSRDDLRHIFVVIDYIKYGALGAAAFLVLAALLLVANTIRLAALARRREIGIMRLVGASSFYIAVPFLLEALVTAAVGIGLAAGGLAVAVKFGIIDTIAERVTFLPWVGWGEYGWTVLLISVLGVALTFIPTLLLTRKYIKV